MTSYRMSLIRHQRRTFLLCKETGMQKWAGMLVETGKAFVDPSAMMTQMRKDSDFWSFPPLWSCVGKHFWSSQSIQRWTWHGPNDQYHNQTDSSEEALPIRSEQCQNTKFSRSRHWKWTRLTDDDLPPSPEKNQQAKNTQDSSLTSKTWKIPMCGNLPSYDRREVCTSHHHEQ